MLIRRLTVEDSAILQACRLRGLLQSPEAFLATYDEVKDTPLVSVEAELRDADIHYVGAFEDGELMGFMRFVRGGRLARRHTAEVRSVYVSDRARRRGVAAALLKQLVLDARQAGIESLTLSVLSSNHAARAFYASAGFVVYGIEPAAIKKGDDYFDQVHMSLQLSGA